MELVGQEVAKEENLYTMDQKQKPSKKKKRGEDDG
jgi:hypothetical protein